MLIRSLRRIALGVVILAACTSPERGAATDTSRRRASADTSLVTTHQMIEALTRDVRESDRELTASEDSISRFMGDSVSALLEQAHATWVEYRKLECDVVRVAFAQGTMAPVAQMECWIGLTDDHRRFLAEQYGYMRKGGATRSKASR